MSLTLYFDTETTGIPDWHAPSDAPHQPHIVQYCGILMDENKRTRMALDTLIEPASFTIPATSTSASNSRKPGTLKRRRRLRLPSLPSPGSILSPRSLPVKTRRDGPPPPPSPSSCAPAPPPAPRP